jgi:general secretion pathway protein H
MTSPVERKRASGFTLLETLVVLTILGLTLALFASRGADHNRSVSLRGAADHLAESLRLARTDAIAQGHSLAFSVITNPPGWHEPSGETTTLPADVSLRVSTVGGFGSAVGDNAIRFEPDGSSSGGAITLSEGAQSLEIRVDWLTGGVAVAKPK